ncbi:MAG: hypothetical protein A2898_05520 [Candidatus Kerfeldbacteria bacterium RIFCSPLOWO2_01_FULL_48_11]|uniref:Purine nucleoside phosphorylase n=1 Tax=Candidatus Kerfeldbacteria bacterium RIFCSPLOWO2_01_FULL_48_11 TaxID=1798543 RepID=A0A1G2AZV5_9BACT|nr:MAG: hypothetical protein UY34_C0017G0021 [Parcubacteria group bacterium GW2011_GWA2_48_9]KKW16736.1 MAG: hypothetical protein UY52_C0001G0056 [Parcubacteria group bacterium GW2011_GWC2_49_9]OGY82463.1 MAG: hypothetical protein A2898_05520 [Candidatus Kerfeldbacteria bacterium RIFCSPLOWO2_01_FULL_48_11]HCJ52283.1 hypothetical protein [Candidatus Kerfeldbacteria bacterium]HCM68683.1 hypothetical protein [Candidatus Kerfeldbacteria bacterium]
MLIVLHTSTKKDGNMSFRYGKRDEVKKNRERFLAKCDISVQDCVAMSLQHGTNCVNVASHDKGNGVFEPGGIETDCLITSEKNLFLFLLIGDCLPVALYDPEQSVIALAHIGRHNAGKGFIASILMKLETEFGSTPQNLIATIGPGIQKVSYLLPANIPQLAEPAWQPFISKVGDNVAVDVPGFVTGQLLQEHVPKKNILVSPVDTATSEDYFSHYRSTRTGLPEGRFAMLLGMR